MIRYILFCAGPNCFRFFNECPGPFKNNQILHTCLSGAGNDNNHAHPDTSMKLGRNVHWHELLEFFSLANQNWSNFKMAALKSKMAATINVKF